MKDIRCPAFVIVICAAMLVGCARAASEISLLGDWNGQIQIQPSPLAIGVSFTKDAAVIDVPAQRLHAKPLSGVKTDPGDVRFAIPGPSGEPRFQGAYDRASDTITGQFVQSATTYPLVLRHGKTKGLHRPQDPEAPFPYRAEDVSYRSGGIMIAGTLTEPGSGGPFAAVLLINGSGRNDRNEELFGHKPFLLLADTLTRAGYAVLRADKRGVGGTGGKLTEADYSALADDVEAGLRYLRGRSEIDAERVGLLGHSEGGYLAPLVAARPANHVAFVVMMAGPAVPGDQVLLLQERLIAQAEGKPAEEIDGQNEFTKKWIPLVKAGDREGIEGLIRQQSPALIEDLWMSEAQIDSMTSTYFRSLVSYDPSPALAALRVPTLAFYGGSDLQVPSEQSEPEARRLLADDPDATVRVFPGLNHLMQPSRTGDPAEYGKIETTIDPAVLDYVTAWLVQRFSPKR